MRKIISILLLFFAVTSFSQGIKTFAFNFDSTKVYLTYNDILSVLKNRNKKIINVCRYTKKDTLVFEGSTLFLGKHKDSLIIDLDYELFTLIDQKKGKISCNGQFIINFYTKKVKKVKDGKKEFVGIYYYDEPSKKHFLTRTLFQDRYPVPFPHF